MTKSYLVDTHCHIDLYKNPQCVVKELEREAVYTIGVTNAPFVFRNMVSLAANCRYVRAAVGLHPELAGTHGEQLNQFRSLLRETTYVGEIGLDYTTNDQSLRRKQRHILETILSWCADDKNKVLTLHSRRAASDVINAVGDHYPGKVILHWFSGNAKEIERAINYGMYFSVNPAMCKSQKGLSLIDRIPMDRLLTESDGPFACNSATSHAGNIRQAVDGVSNLWKMSFEDAKNQIFRNFKSVLVNRRETKL